MEKLKTVLWYVVPYLPLLYVVFFEDLHHWWWQSLLIFSVIIILGFQRVAYEIRREPKK